MENASYAIYQTNNRAKDLAAVYHRKTMQVTPIFVTTITRRVLWVDPYAPSGTRMRAIALYDVSSGREPNSEYNRGFQDTTIVRKLLQDVSRMFQVIL